MLIIVLLALMKIRAMKIELKLCDNKFTWCFQKAKQVYYVHRASVQGTYRYHIYLINNTYVYYIKIYCIFKVKPGFHISQFIGDLLSGIAEGENDFRNTRILSIVDHRQ